MQKKDIRIYLNNNPKCKAVLENVVKRETWSMNNIPFIIVNGENIDNGSRKIKISIDEKEICERVVEINDNCFELKVELDEPIINPQNARITLDEEIYSVPINLKRLHGTVKYYDGTPIKEPIISITQRGIRALGNDNGEFEVYICGKELQIGVFEKKYSIETLEAWLYNIELNNDERLDIQIGTLEVFGIHMWGGLMCDYIHFTPMSLARAKHAMAKGFSSDLDLLECEGVWPTLDKCDIKLFADGQKVKALTFNVVDEYLVEINDKTYTRPSYVVSIPKGYEDKVIKIEIQHRFEEEEGLVLERGEGYYFWR